VWFVLLLGSDPQVIILNVLRGDIDIALLLDLYCITQLLLPKKPEI